MTTQAERINASGKSVWASEREKEGYSICSRKHVESGNTLDLVLDNQSANDCEGHAELDCSCEDVSSGVACLFGPDSVGHFSVEEVPQSVADNCDKSWCVCSTHPNFMMIQHKRVQEAGLTDWMVIRTTEELIAENTHFMCQRKASTNHS